MIVLLLFLAPLASAEAIFKNIPQCDSNFITEISSIVGDSLPTNILSELQKDAPWAVNYASKGLFPDDAEFVSIDLPKKEITVRHEKGKHSKQKLDWEEKKGVLSDGSLRWHIIKCEIGMMSFYLCDTEGKPRKERLGGVAVRVGSAGGIPDETKDAIEEATTLLQEEMNINLEVVLALS